MKFMLLFLFLGVHLVPTSNQQTLDGISSNETSTSSPAPSTLTTTTLSPWDQAYIEVFGKLPPEAQTSPTPTIPDATTTFPIVVDGLAPEFTYQLKNGTVITLANLTNLVDPSPPPTPSPIQPPSTQGCRDKARNCEEMRSMCNVNLYSDTLADFCKLTCQRCGSCVDKSAKCQFWKQRGYCSSVSFIPQHRGIICARTCNLC